MNTSTQGTDFAKDFISQIPGIFEKGMVQGVKMDWNIFISFLTRNWLLLIVIYFVIFFYATLEAMMKRWGMFGSILYNTFYFGVLFIVGLIWGPQIFLDDVFKASCVVILYPICYLVVGYILDKFNLK
jgi:hypothetical protein